MAHAGIHPAHTLTRALILLNADADGPVAWPDERIAEALDVCRMTVVRVRQQFAAEGLDATLPKKKPTGRQYRKLDGEQEARLVALACSAPPDGQAGGRMRLLVDAPGRAGGGRGDRPLDGLPDASRNELKPWLKQQQVVPPKASGAFVAAMEDVIDVYHRPPDPARPVVCVDEGGKQLIGDVRQPLPAHPGSPAKEDSEYERHGTANLFVAFEPLAGRRTVEVTERRTAVDFARFLQRLLDEEHRDAERVVLVTDDLNTHALGSLYEAFEPAEARRLAGRIEWHYTPKHGSWLNMAEIELSVLARQCLDRGITDREALTREAAAWEEGRKAAAMKADWQFTTPMPGSSSRGYILQASHMTH